MVRRVFRAVDDKIFENEAKATWHEQHVLALGKLKAVLLESYLMQQATQKQDVVDKEFISKLSALLLSYPVRTAVENILRKFDENIPKLYFRPVGRKNGGDQRGSGAALDTTPTRMAGRATPDLGAAKK